MYLDLTKILGINDLDSFEAKGYPIFRATKSLFDKLTSAPMTTKIAKELPELIVKMTGIILINQVQLQKDLKDAISFFKAVVGFAMVLFFLNLSINLTRLTYSCYINFCIEEIRQKRQVEEAQKQLSLWAELTHINGRNCVNRVETM